MDDNKKLKPPAIQDRPETKFPLERLRGNCVKLFGCSTSSFDGAMLNVKGPLTVNEAKAKINAWLNKPVFRKRG